MRQLEDREIDELDLRPLLDPRRRCAARTCPAPVPHLHVHPKRDPLTVVDDAQDDHVGQSDQQLAHARRVNFHRALQNSAT